MKFYEQIIQYETNSIEFGKKLDEEANRLLAFHKDKFNEEEMEVILSQKKKKKNIIIII